MKAQSVKEVLIAARWIIENVGWCQGFFCCQKDGRQLDLSEAKKEPQRADSFCLLGAINMVESKQYTHEAAIKIIEQVLGPRTYPVAFNDGPYRTKDQVLKVLDKAIKVAK